MTKFYPEHDLSYVYRVEQEAHAMRSEEVAHWLNAAGRAIRSGLRKLDMWFEAARQVNAVGVNTFTGMATGRYHLPAIFTDAEKVQISHANENRDQRAA